ncbi:MAG: hypothetical protein CSB16_02730, partial [Clostridiales bacterium]
RSIAFLLVLLLVFSSCAKKDELSKSESSSSTTTASESSKTTTSTSTKEKESTSSTEKESTSEEPEESTDEYEKYLPTTIAYPNSDESGDDITFEKTINKDEYTGFSESQLKQLNEKGFLILEQNQDEFIEDRYHSVYENANYSETPVFVSTDAVLNAFDIFYSGSIIRFELNEFYLGQASLSLEMTKKLLLEYNSNSNDILKPYFEEAIAYFYTADRLFFHYGVDEIFSENASSDMLAKFVRLEEDFKNLEANIPESIKNISDVEHELIVSADSVSRSPMFGYDVDYSQFMPRGHYTSTASLKNYFMGQMWLSHPGFELKGEKSIRTALIIASTLYNEAELMEKWQRMYDITSYFSSTADDIMVLDLKKILDEKVDYKNKGFDNLASDNFITDIKPYIDDLREPKIKPITSSESAYKLSTQKQYRFMGQRYNADQFILTKLIKLPVKPQVSSFEFFNVLGNDLAGEIAEEIYSPREKWPEYDKALASAKQEYLSKKDEIFANDMYHNYLSVVEKTLNEKVDMDNPNVPKYMKQEEYEYMKINSALGAFAQLKHANVLYSKQLMAEMGAPEDVCGFHYLAPNVEVYEALLATVEDAKKKLSIFGIKEPEQNDFEPVFAFAKTLKRFVKISKKELAGEDLTNVELMELAYFGGFCDAMINEVTSLEWKHGIKMDGKILSRPVVSDIATILPLYLELGIGMPLDIYVLVKQSGKGVVAKGVIYSSYEFYSDKRLTDETWLDLLAEGGEYGRIESIKDEMRLVNVMPYA